MGEGKLSIGTKLGYGVCDIGNCLFVTATAFVLLNYLTDTVGLGAALAGIALMVGRVWDAFYDPVIGYISDKTATKMGRRKPFMLGGAIPLAIFMVIMFTNPALIAGSGISQTTLFIYTMVVYLILCTAYSTVSIPYTSLAPEMTSDYHEKTSLNGYRSGFAVIGTILGAGLALPIVALAPDSNQGFILMGLIFGSIMLAAALTTVFIIKEPAQLKPAKTKGFVRTYIDVFKNRPYVIILLTYIFNVLAVTIASAIVIYYFKYVLLAESATTWAILIFIGGALVFIPISVILSKRVGKKLAYGTGFLLMAVALMTLFFCGHTQGLTFTLVLMAVAGAGYGFTYALPFTIVADAIEYDYQRTGERREGAFFGVWTWGFKMGQALAIFLMGIILSAMGYAANVIPQPENAQLAIRLFVGPIPAAIFVIAAVLLYFYPITEKRYKEILGEIAEMEARKA